MVRFNRNDIKISFDERPLFFVNEAKKTVVCKLSGEVCLPQGDWFVPSLSIDCDVCVTGVAKCNGDDVFDVNRGKRIALAKAENKAYLTVLHRAEDAAKDLQVLINAVDEFADKTYRCCAHNEDYIEKLSYPAHPDYIVNVPKPKRGREVK